MAVEINCDMGESFGLWKMADDEALMPLITVANIACGFHASDFNHMHDTVKLAKKYGVRAGAHPSLPDLQGFGRRPMQMEREELANCLIYQVGALKGFLDAQDMPLSHIKPHGALFEMAANQEHIAHAIADCADVFKVPLYGQINCLHEEIYQARGHEFVSEYYADLFYGDKGELIATRKHDAIDEKDAVERLIRAIEEGKTKSVNGNDVEIRADSVCVHSDTPGAVALAKAVHEAAQPYMAQAAE
ncbi:5-oxoprolinase subunit PxpA [Minwuia sp.]|uniref:5-oxoprolinase subunit PxpA n=1 Tax=Minwuia sp. TaxID=2493630 RepID=UPI003A926634